MQCSVNCVGSVKQPVGHLKLLVRLVTAETIFCTIFNDQLMMLLVMVMMMMMVMLLAHVLIGELTMVLRIGILGSPLLRLKSRNQLLKFCSLGLKIWSDLS